MEISDVLALGNGATGMHSRNTTGVQCRLVDALGNHGDLVQRGRVEIVLLLLRKLLLKEIAASIRRARSISSNRSRSGVRHASNNGPRPADELSNCLRDSRQSRAELSTDSARRRMGLRKILVGCGEGRARALAGT